MLQVQAGSRVVAKINFTHAAFGESYSDTNVTGQTETDSSYDVAYLDMNAIVNITMGGNSVKRGGVTCGVPCDGGNISIVINDTGLNIDHTTTQYVNITLVSSDGFKSSRRRTSKRNLYRYR